ncbi:UvrD-helicase domain-containing protein [Photobacterium leiognathi]|uniref:UvrD-helicase domain-containing protein n=1 Tax=Photobacterium leiognathi TaxID=553611 RepID=UPI001EDEB97D|nr:UvrD-helicase domain-containing protein [Photobacterium leiognathi]MCG3884905.1 UvrD-helicase domain-containing protein [Photobacterium leiognathi]
MKTHDIKNLPSEVIDKINELNKDLNPEKEQGAETLFDPTMLIAGAGAGKTNTLTHHAATMIEAGISPLDLLIVTFTNKASTELKERLEK